MTRTGDHSAVRARRYPSEGLRHFIEEVLHRLGLPAEGAALAAGILHDTDLAGVDTHGIANLAAHPHYAPGLRSGFVSTSTEPLILRDAPVAAAWDSQRGFGPLVAHQAMSAAVAKAEQTGVGMVSVRDGRHFGANGQYAELAARRGLIGIVTADTPPAAFPPGGLRAAVGTNPFAFAAPVAERPPLVVDIAMTAVSGSRVTAARRAGADVPEGWVVDRDGQPTTDPTANRHGGALELLGGDVAGHKGFGLALVVQTLGTLAGNHALDRQASEGWSQGQWFAACAPELFIDPADFEVEMRAMVDAIHAVPAEPGREVLVPGERRAACRVERIARGIPIEGDVVVGLHQLAQETGVPFPEPIAGA